MMRNLLAKSVSIVYQKPLVRMFFALKWRLNQTLNPQMDSFYKET
jgi:hypothetical protein